MPINCCQSATSPCRANSHYFPQTTEKIYTSFSFAKVLHNMYGSSHRQRAKFLPSFFHWQNSKMEWGYLSPSFVHLRPRGPDTKHTHWTHWNNERIHQSTLKYRWTQRLRNIFISITQPRRDVCAVFQDWSWLIRESVYLRNPKQAFRQTDDLAFFSKDRNNTKALFNYLLRTAAVVARAKKCRNLCVIQQF